MLLRRLKVSGMLSFGPRGVDLPLEPLNVLIGANGSGKSNLLEAIALLRSATNDLAEPIARRGGPIEFFWKGPDALDTIYIETIVDFIGFRATRALRHTLDVTRLSGNIAITDERVEPLNAKLRRNKMMGFRRSFGGRTLDNNVSGVQLSKIKNSSPPTTKISVRAKLDASILHFSHPRLELLYLKERYEAIRLYRSWSFGPDAPLRTPCSAHGRSDFLDEGGGNLALVLSQFYGDHKQALLNSLRSLYEGIVDFRCPVTGGTVGLFLEEKGNRAIPATLLSDGTLRYLCLLAVLLHPKPPPLICIEEPELGLHPDLLPTVSDLMRDASQRSQLVVTTHSDVLVDTLTDQPESVVICEKHDGETEMRRLDKADLSKWLKDYSLGNLWMDGELGGKRW